MKNLPSGVTIPSGGAGAQISNTRWVDAGAASGGDGSIGAPFQTIQEGLTALAGLAGNKAALMVFPGAYEEASPVWTGDQQLLIANAVPGFWGLGNTGQPPQPFVQNQIDCSAASETCSFSGLELFEGVESPTANFFGCKIWQLLDISTNALFQQCTLIGVVAEPTGSFQWDQCLFNGSLFQFPTGGTIIATNCEVSGSPGPTFDFTGAGGPNVLLVDSQTNYWLDLSVAVITNGTVEVMA